jgi:hypothetical protein
MSSTTDPVPRFTRRAARVAATSADPLLP